MIQRFSKPRILIEKEQVWLDAHLQKVEQDPSIRPSSKQYGHPEIRDALRTMSHGKCFYCERKLSEREQEIDHYIDVAERPDLAFVWENLYLSCEGCNNGKPSHRNIPVEECVDPCDPLTNPSTHIVFRQEQAEGIPGTKGTRTIQKYRLNNEALALQRAKALLEFKDVLLRIVGQASAKMRRQFTPEQRRLLLRFTEPDMPFSAMFSGLLALIPALVHPAEKP